jgi:hypothetical protein
VLDILKEEKTKWRKFFDGLECDDVAETLREKLEEEKQRRTIEKAEAEQRKAEAEQRKAREAMAHVFAVGDAVISKYGDPGVVTAVDGNGVTVRFAGGEWEVVNTSLEHRAVLDAGNRGE